MHSSKINEKKNTTKFFGENQILASYIKLLTSFTKMVTLK